MCGEQRSDYASSQASGINTIRTQSTVGKVPARVFIVSISLHKFLTFSVISQMVRDTILDLGEKNGLLVTFVALFLTIHGRIQSYSNNTKIKLPSLFQAQP